MICLKKRWNKAIQCFASNYELLGINVQRIFDNGFIAANLFKILWSHYKINAIYGF